MKRNELQKHTLNLRKGDWDYIDTVCRPQGVATGLLVRTIISQYVDNLREREAASSEPLPRLDLSL